MPSESEVIREVLRTGYELAWPGFLHDGLLVGPAQGTKYYALWVVLAKAGVPQFASLRDARENRPL